MEWSEGGGKWYNCNSIINKYIFFKKTNSSKEGRPRTVMVMKGPSGKDLGDYRKKR